MNQELKNLIQSEKALKNVLGLLSEGQFKGEWAEAVLTSKKFIDSLLKQASQSIQMIMDEKLKDTGEKSDGQTQSGIEGALSPS